MACWRVRTAGLGAGLALVLFGCSSDVGLDELVDVAAALPALQSPDAAENDARVVSTTQGALRGVVSGSVEQFLGIPYAAPPTGELRFAPPAPPPAWQGVRSAAVAGPVCIQGSPPVFGSSEDCLSLNVYRPVSTDASTRLPVLVWVHGGSFVSGAGSVYDPRRLVEQNGILVVTLNYRLGALGFLALPELTGESADGVSGDYGLMDQQAALRWVRSNVGAFGGDAERVTLQGESAGGAAVCAQLASPPAAGLFSRAVIQSGSCASVPLALAEQQGTRLADALGCGGATNVSVCLRTRTPDEIAAATARLAAVFGPVVGGAFLPSAPNAVVAAGAQHRMPVLIGGLRDEMRLFAAQHYPLAPELYLSRLAADIPLAPASEIAALYPLEDYPEAYAAYSAALSDSGVYLGGSLGGCVTEALADAFSASTTTYAYELDDPEFIWAGGPFLAGASHASDLSYLFDFNGIVLNEPFEDTQQSLAGQMVRAWGAFVRDADPSSAGESAWPAYDTRQRQMAHFEPGAVQIRRDFRERHHCAFWWQAWAAAAAGAL